MPLLKETARSLRQYFGLIAGLQTLAAVAKFRTGGSALPLLPIVENAVMALLFWYIVVGFPALLRRPTLIKVALVIGLVESVASFGYQVRDGFKAAPTAAAVLGVLIYWYLWRSVARLSAEANAAAKRPSDVDVVS